MQLGQSKMQGIVGRKKRWNQTSQVRVTINVTMEPFGVLHGSDTIYFESGVKPAELGGMVIPATTAVDKVVRQPSNAVVIP